MAELPPEIITNILTRLPVKSLLRFRCVSKAWSALIDSKHFTKLHLRQSAEAKTYRNLVSSHRRRVDFVCLDSLEAIVHHEQPFNCEAFGAKVLGSCDGLLLLHFGSLELGLWNPSTRSYHQIPSQSIDITLPREIHSDEVFVTHGLGYDPVIDDYKVMRMIIFSEKCTNTFVSEVKVYSMKLNSWKRVQDLPYYLCYDIRSTGVYASGALHWDLAENLGKELQSLIIAFDFATEKHRSVPLPDYGNEKNVISNVHVLEGCLYWSLVYPECRVDVWVMKDYGVVESWTKLFSVEQPKHIREFRFLYPLAYSKNKEEILLGHDDGKLLWFNLKSNVVQDIHICGMPSIFDADVCLESLVRFGTVKELHGQRKKEKMQKRIEKKRNGFLSKGFNLKL